MGQFAPGSGRRWSAAFAALVATAVLGGCSSAVHSAQPNGEVVHITEKDFKISGPSTRVDAGDVVLSVENQGPDDHELIVVRADDAPLPLRADGVTVDEDRLDPDTIGALEPGAPGNVRQLAVHLAPGHYTMFCNMAGHYLGGMHAELDVT